MSVLLVGSSIVTTMLIPPEAFAVGGEAYGRALAYLAHEHLGETFGTIYDLSTVAILWFAGRVRDGRSAQSGAALPAALRHGAGVGEGDAAARRHLHDASRSSVTIAVQGGRGRAGRRVCDRRAGADGIGRAGGHAARHGASVGRASATLLLDA